MEWVETTGRTVEEAKDAALDQLGVDEHDAEFELVEEPKFGLFGRLRAEARVRARVRPTTPRPKDDRRDRRKRKPRAGSDEAAGEEASSNGFRRRRRGGHRHRRGRGWSLGGTSLNHGDGQGGDHPTPDPPAGSSGGGGHGRQCPPPTTATGTAARLPNRRLRQMTTAGTEGSG